MKLEHRESEEGQTWRELRRPFFVCVLRGNHSTADRIMASKETQVFDAVLTVCEGNALSALSVIETVKTRLSTAVAEQLSIAMIDDADYLSDAECEAFIERAFLV